MYTQVEKSKENKNKTVANAVAQKHSGGASTFHFVDNRPEAVLQRKLQEMANSFSAQQQPIQKKESNTGLPDNLKTGIENLSGYSMDDVKVHYNSGKPAQFQTHAYAQGADIHLASGQEKHLPHEAWHVVQQKQGRVKPTMQMKGDVKINDDVDLEKEADVMGLRSLSAINYASSSSKTSSDLKSPKTSRTSTVQRSTDSGLNRGTEVIVTDRNDPNYKKTGKVFTEKTDGYEVRFGKEFVIYKHDAIDVAVASEVTEGLSWSSEEMEGLNEVSYKLATQYSPNEYAYISLGSSPLLIIECIRQRFIQNQGEDLLTLLTLPISEVDDEGFLDRVDKILSGDLEKLSLVEGQLKNLRDYMMNYVSPAQLDGKKPLLIDYAAGGRTLTVMRYHLMASYIYMGNSSLANSVEVVALNGGKEVISPSSSYRDLMSYYDKKDEIYRLFGQESNEEDLRYPDIQTIDPTNESSEFLLGLSNRKLKDEFGYRSWDKTSYADILAGRKTSGVMDQKGIGRAERAIKQIINILDNFH
ncbi:DUF4157 domain-containing protein [cf. Phormidesmis sp. LEGE 11477]|uniref:eCIS core domain-containing protein n=1 Tax=cf. Phormidesmis sp. LEGE 11477 TaxID=1828680 RepID=UPI00187F2E6D|nr:DUF4157 domain-containing protein [cf. Phormidesmis sp. LEGE 11477]MBE9062403.1 DUF4157 domain-containing protein [cf. Phormidesmis sp. LEGE 11477]